MQGLNCNTLLCPPLLLFNATSLHLNPSLKLSKSFGFYPFQSLPKFPMLKLLSSTAASCRQTHAFAAVTALRNKPSSSSPFLDALSQITGLTSRRSRTVTYRRFFCSDSSGDGGEDGSLVEVELKHAKTDSEESDSKSSSAIVSTNPRPEDYLTVGWIKFLFSFVIVWLVGENETEIKKSK